MLVNSLASLFLILFHTLAAVASDVNVCYLGTDVNGILPRANDVGAEYGGFQLAIDELNRSASPHRFSLIFLNEDFARKRDLAKQIEFGVQKNCVLYVGLVTSKDAILAGSLIKEKQLFAVSSTATSVYLDDSAPYVRSLSSSTRSWAKAIRSLKRIQNPIIIAKQGDIYSAGLVDQLRSMIPDQKVIYLNRQAVVDSHDFEHLKSRVASGVSLILTTYPKETIPFLNQFQSSKPRLHKDTTVIVSPAWMEPQAFSDRPEIFKSLPPFKIFSPWNVKQPSTSFQEFARRFKSVYDRYPDHDSVYDYDAVMILRACSKQKSSIAICLRELRSFEGLTGTYKFVEGRAHPDREEYLLNFDWRGMVPAKVLTEVKQ